MIYLLVLFGVAFARSAHARAPQEAELFKKYLDDTRAEHDITLEERMALNPKAKAWENSGRFQGDMLLDDVQSKALVQSYSSRKAYIFPNTKWPDNTVVYEFVAGEFDSSQQSAILAAIHEIERNTCVRFRQRRAGERNFVRITGGPDGCYANIGYWSTRGAHTLNLARATPGRGCFLHTIIIHELLHILGFVHMQSTYNRYDYIRVLWDNILEGTENNFERFTSNQVSNHGVPYEYASNMHYGPFAFSKNGRPTIQALHGNGHNMGQQDFVTQGDWLRVNRHYNCPRAWT